MESYPSLYPPLETIAVAPTPETLAATKKNPTEQFSLQKVGEQAVAPTLETLAAAENKQSHLFRLQKIDELEAFLHSEIEYRSRILKKYRRAVNIVDVSCVGLAVAMAAGGGALTLTGIGVIPGVSLGFAAVLPTLLEVKLRRRFSAKATKHDEIRMLALSKLNTVHSHTSKALEDCKISDEEYKLICDEVEKYRAMKDEIRRRSVPVTPIIDEEEAKKALLEKGHEDILAALIKHLGASARPSV